MEDVELNKLVAAAKKKNSKALEELYKRTNHIAYYTALGILKNDADAQDIVQDSYINVFASINRIQDNAFISYLKTAVANTCKNSLKQKNAILFNNDEEESSILDNIQELGEDFLPDLYITRSEKRKQILSIINNLSDVQRATILFFYFNEMSISQIAEVMECNQSTVKSRLAYAKQHIKDEVEKLEQQEGDKLYGKAFIPVPFLKKLFAEDSKNHVLPEKAAKAIFHNVITSSAATGTTSMGGFAVGGLFAKFAGLTTLAKATIAGVGAVVVVGGSVAGVAATGHLNNNQVKAAAVAASSSEVSSQLTTSEIENSSSVITSSNLMYSSAVSSAAVSTASTVSSKPIVQKAVTSKASSAVKSQTKKATTTKSSQTSSKSTSSAKTTSSKQTTLSGDVAGNDPVANAQWIVSHLGFRQSENTFGAYYNPNNKAMASAQITVGHNNGTTFITFYRWGSSIDSVTKGLFKFYLPNNYMKLYNMVNDWNNGSDECVGKHYTIDGRSIIFYGYEDAGQIDVQISDK